MDALEQMILDLLREMGFAFAESLAVLCGVPVADVIAALRRLHERGLVFYESVPPLCRWYHNEYVPF